MASPIDTKSSNLIDELFKAVEKNDTIVVSTIVYKLNINYKLNRNYKQQINNIDESGVGLLLCCLRNKNNDILKQLITLPALNINTTNIFGMTALHIVCVNNNTDALKMLLTSTDVLVNSKDKDGDTPLICAIKFAHRAVLKILLDDDRVELTYGLECYLGSVEPDTYLVRECRELIDDEKRRRMGIILEKVAEYGIHGEETPTLEHNEETQLQLYLSPSPQDQDMHCNHEETINDCTQKDDINKLNSLKRHLHLEVEEIYEFEKIDESIYDDIIENGPNTF
jgi:hypothetical protein